LITSDADRPLIVHPRHRTKVAFAGSIISTLAASFTLPPKAEKGNDPTKTTLPTNVMASSTGLTKIASLVMAKADGTSSIVLAKLVEGIAIDSIRTKEAMRVENLELI